MPVTDPTPAPPGGWLAGLVSVITALTAAVTILYNASREWRRWWDRRRTRRTATTPAPTAEDIARAIVLAQRELDAQTDTPHPPPSKRARRQR